MGVRHKYFTPRLLECKTRLMRLIASLHSASDMHPDFPLDLTNYSEMLNMQSNRLLSGFKLKFDCLPVLLFNCSGSCHIQSLAVDSLCLAFYSRNFYIPTFVPTMRRVSGDGLRDDNQTQLRSSCLPWKLQRSPKTFWLLRAFHERSSYPSAPAVVFLAVTGNLFQLVLVGRYS